MRLVTFFLLGFVFFGATPLGKFFAIAQSFDDCLPDRISGEVHWLPGDGVKHVCGRTVQEDGLLTIHPGVRVVFQEGSSLEFAGGVKASGREDSPIVFEADGDVFWSVGFSAINEKQSLSWVHFINPKRPIDFSSDTVEIKDVTVSGGYGMEFGSGKYVLSKVSLNVLSGDALGFYGSVADIDNLEIKSKGALTGISLYDKAHVSISSSTISDAVISGISVYDSSFDSRFLRVSGESLVGIEVYGDSQVVLATSTFVGSTYRAAGFGEVQVDLSGVWWGNNDELQEGVNYLGLINFTPWLTKDPFLPLPRVMFLPGIQASRLVLEEGGSQNQLWEPNRKKDIEKLLLDEHGVSINQNIKVGDVIDEINVLFDGKNIYKSFLTKLKSWKDGGVIGDYQVVPYDWRVSIHKLALDLIETVQTFSPTVIIGHSNGGLLARVILQLLPDSLRNDIKLVLVGSPQLGSFQGLASVLHGDSLAMLGGLIMDTSLGQRFLKYMVSAYTLLPWGMSSKDVLIQGGSPDQISWQNLLLEFPFGEDGYDADFSFPDISTSALTEAENVYQIVNRHPLISSTTLAIYGSNITTPVGLSYKVKEGCFLKNLLGRGGVCEKKKKVSYSLLYGDGDGTVEVASAQALSQWDREEEVVSIDLKKEGVRHANMMESKTLLSTIESFLKGDQLAQVIDLDRKETLRVSVHSPVSLLGRDAHGNVTGIVIKDGEEWLVENIPNSSFHQYGQAKEIIIDSNDPEEKYSFEIEGEDAGYFELNINSLGTQGIPIGPESKGSFSASAASHMIEVDYSPLGDKGKKYSLVLDGSEEKTFPYEEIEQEIFNHALNYYCRDRVTQKVRLKHGSLQKDKNM